MSGLPSTSPIVLYVGPGDSSTNGTGTSTPAASMRDTEQGRRDQPGAAPGRQASPARGSRRRLVGRSRRRDGSGLAIASRNRARSSMPCWASTGLGSRLRQITQAMPSSGGRERDQQPAEDLHGSSVRGRRADARRHAGPGAPGQRVARLARGARRTPRHRARPRWRPRRTRPRRSASRLPSRRPASARSPSHLGEHGPQVGLVVVLGGRQPAARSARRRHHQRVHHVGELARRRGRDAHAVQPLGRGERERRRHLDALHARDVLDPLLVEVAVAART